MSESAALVLPGTVRACRALVWFQAVFTAFASAFVLLVAVLLGGSVSLPFRDTTVGGGAATVLGLVYVVAALALAWLGGELGRLRPWARPALVGVQAFLAILLLLRAADLSVSTVINAALFAAILVLLFVPDTGRALRSPARA